jgi:hypothetical protein
VRGSLSEDVHWLSLSKVSGGSLAMSVDGSEAIADRSMVDMVGGIEVCCLIEVGGRVQRKARETRKAAGY